MHAERRLSSHQREAELILLLARGHLSAHSGEGARALLPGGIDWQYLLETCQSHGVAPLVYKALRQVDGDDVPIGTMDQLRKQYHHNMARNILMRRELVTVAKALVAGGVDVIPMKGPMLAEEVYGDLGARVFCDLDVLVRRADVLRAKDVLLTLGYRPEYVMTRAQEGIYLNSGCEYGFGRRAEGEMPVHVELHWNVLPRTLGVMIDPDMLWERTRVASIEDVTVWRLSLESQFLALCLHGWKHFWSVLMWLCDLREFLEVFGREVHWGEVRAMVRRLRAEAIVGKSLDLVRTLWGLSAHCDAPSDLMVPGGYGGSEIGATYFDWKPPSSNLAIHRFYCGFLTSWTARVQYPLRLLMTPSPTDFVELKLPDWAAPLYGVMRPTRVAWKVLRGRQCF